MEACGDYMCSSFMLMESATSCLWILSSMSFFICSSSVIIGGLLVVVLVVSAEIRKLGLSILYSFS